MFLQSRMGDGSAYFHSSFDSLRSKAIIEPAAKIATNASQAPASLPPRCFFIQSGRGTGPPGNWWSQ